MRRKFRLKVVIKNQKHALFKKYFLRFFPVVFILVSSVLFYKALGETSALQIILAIRNMSWESLGGASFLSALSFIFLGLAELLAFHSLCEKKVPRQEILKVAFLAFGIGNTIPMGGIAASTVRFRHYSRHGLSTEKILKIISFSSLGGWLGFIFLAGLMSLAIDFLPAHALPLTSWTMRCLGVCFVSLICLYLFLSFKQLSYTFLKVVFRAPQLKISMTQILIAMTDWIIVGVALYILLPGQYEIHFQEFFLVFLFSQILGVLIHVPGGIGILEFLFVTILLSGQSISSELMASFLVFRFIYYIIPFALSISYFAWSEASSRDSVIFHAANKTKRIISSFAPAASTIVISLTGVVLVIIIAAALLI